MAIRTDVYSSSNGSNRTPSDDELSKKISQIREITQCDEELALMTLHDCEYNLEQAINKIICKDQIPNSEWIKSHKKSRKNIKTDKVECVSVDSKNDVANSDGSITQEIPKIVNEGKCFKNYDLIKDIKKSNSHVLLSPQNHNFVEYDLNKIWDENTLIIYNPEHFPNSCKTKKIDVQEKNTSNPNVTDESIIFKKRCSTKPPPKGSYSLASPVHIVTKTFYNSTIPRFKFGDTEIEDSLTQLNIPTNTNTIINNKSHSSHTSTTAAATTTTIINHSDMSHSPSLPTSFTHHLSSHPEQQQLSYLNNNEVNDDDHEKYYFSTSSRFIDNTNKIQSNPNNNDPINKVSVSTSIVTAPSLPSPSSTTFSIEKHVQQTSQSTTPQQHQQQQSQTPHNLTNRLDDKRHFNNNTDNSIFNPNNYTKLKDVVSTTENNNYQNSDVFKSNVSSNYQAQNNYNSGNVYFVPNLMMNGLYMTLNNSAPNSQFNQHFAQFPFSQSFSQYMDDSDRITDKKEMPHHNMPIKKSVEEKRFDYLSEEPVKQPYQMNLPIYLTTLASQTQAQVMMSNPLSTNQMLPVPNQVNSQSMNSFDSLKKPPYVRSNIPTKNWS